MKCLISDCMAVCRLELPVCRRSQNRATGCQSGGLPTDRAAAQGVWGISPKTFSHTQPVERDASGASIRDWQLAGGRCEAPDRAEPGSDLYGTTHAERTPLALGRGGNRRPSIVASPARADDDHRSTWVNLCHQAAIARIEPKTSVAIGYRTLSGSRGLASRTAPDAPDAPLPHPSAGRTSPWRVGASTLSQGLRPALAKHAVQAAWLPPLHGPLTGQPCSGVEALPTLSHPSKGHHEHQ
jgi:hypothetical protein